MTGPSLRAVHLDWLQRRPSSRTPHTWPMRTSILKPRPAEPFLKRRVRRIENGGPALKPEDAFGDLAPLVLGMLPGVLVQPLEFAHWKLTDRCTRTSTGE